MTFWEFLGYALWGTLIVSYLLALLHVLRDLFRSGLSGWMKAVWVVLLFILPFIGQLTNLSGFFLFRLPYFILIGVLDLVALISGNPMPGIGLIYPF